MKYDLKRGVQSSKLTSMNKLTFALALFSCILLTSSSCDDDMADPMEPEDIYEGCCGTETFEWTLDSGKVYIANMVTPNFDGLNDLFVVSATGNLALDLSLKIYDRDDELIYDGSNGGQPGIWDVSVADTIYKGRFTYEIGVLPAGGFPQILMGTACSFVCDTTPEVIEDVSRCVFPVQIDSAGCFDATLPSLETCL